jgi:6-phosphogluconolactonase (cycloisomerase 2 family)
MKIRNACATAAAVVLTAGVCAPIACGDSDTNASGGSASTGSTHEGGGGTTATSTIENGGSTSTTTTENGGSSQGGSSAGGGGSGGAPEAAPKNVLYIEKNDPADNANAVLAFKRAVDGSLTPLATPSFPTGGAGIANPTQGLGPDDSDLEIVASPDHKRIFVVNGGSNSIAVFDAHADGTLTKVAGSPFATGGVHPVSIGLAGSVLYVVHQGDQATAPDYRAMSISATGALAPIASSTVAAGMTPSIALVTADHKLVFGDDFMAPLMAAPAGPLRSFTVGNTGLLTNAPNTPMNIPTIEAGQPLALGMALHPTEKILYVNFVQRGQVGVYTYDATGALTYVTETAVMGPAPCWARVSPDGKWLYTTDTANDSISALDVTSPLAPVFLQNVALADQGPLFTTATGMAPTSQAFQEELSPDGNFIYVVSQRSNPDVTVTVGNVIHVLAVAANGMLTEKSDVALDVSTATRPEGLVVF